MVILFALASAGLGFTSLPSGAAAQLPGSLWSITPSPDVTTFDLLTAVSCFSMNSCMALGTSGGSSDQILLEHWDGSAWTIEASPALEGANGTLLSLSCPSQTDCVAVGSAVDTSDSIRRTLVESWNGSSWSVVPSPSPGLSSSGLVSVACISPDSCVAVGGYNSASSVDQALVENWNGVSWSEVPAANTSNEDGLSSVACPSLTDCIAVGSASDYPLIETWNGSVWAVISNPHPATVSQLSSVSCSGPSFCMAVGPDYTSPEESPLIEAWDGTSWAIVPSAKAGKQINDLEGVSCVSANECYATGIYTAGSQNHVLIEMWNGTTWSIAPGKNPTQSVGLVGLTCLGPTTCVGVGGAGSGSSRVTLVESLMSISTTALPVGTEGQPYSATLTASGGNPPYAWKIFPGQGKLPSGLKLSRSTGVISGTPRESGTFSFTAEAIATPTSLSPKGQSAIVAKEYIGVGA